MKYSNIRADITTLSSVPKAEHSVEKCYRIIYGSDYKYYQSAITNYNKMKNIIKEKFILS